MENGFCTELVDFEEQGFEGAGCFGVVRLGEPEEKEVGELHRHGTLQRVAYAQLRHHDETDRQ